MGVFLAWEGLRLGLITAFGTGYTVSVTWMLKLRISQAPLDIFLLVVAILVGIGIGHQLVSPWIEAQQQHKVCSTPQLGALSRYPGESLKVYTARYWKTCGLMGVLGIGLGCLLYWLLTQHLQMPDPWGSVLGVAAGTGTLTGLYSLEQGQQPRGVGVSGQYVRGSVLADLDDPSLKTGLDTPKPNCIFWGGWYLPMSDSYTHFLVCGCSGSGKTMTLTLLMQSALDQIKPGSGCRAMVYDAKCDVMSQLAGMGLNCPIVSLNPFDNRASALDVADITTLAEAESLGAILIQPKENAPQPYFDHAPQALCLGVIQVFMTLKPQRWDLRDVLLATENLETLKTVLQQTPGTRALIAQHLNTETTTNNVFSNLQTHLQKYRVVAALWNRCKTRVSLKTWMEEGFILVLGNDQRARPSIDALNQLVFKQASERLLTQPESPHGQTWLFLDEAREIGRLDGLRQLLTQGRSKKTCICLGFQSISGMRDVYGADQANELLGQCRQRAFLKSDRDSAAWASQLIGQVEVIETQYGQSSSTDKDGKPQQSYNSNRVRQVKDLVLPSQIQNLPIPNPTIGLTGYYQAGRFQGVYKKTLSGAFIEETRKKKDPNVPDFVPRSDCDQELEPWSDAEKAELGVLTGAQMLQQMAADSPLPADDTKPRRRTMRKRRASDVFLNSSHRDLEDKTKEQ